MCNMKASIVAFAILVIIFIDASIADKKKLQIGVKKKIENCTRRSKKGDVLKMHYTVSLWLNQNIIN